MGGAKVAMPTGPTPLDKSQPGSNQHPLSTKEEARAGEKEKPRSEDAGLDGVAARTVSEHVPVKQEPHIPSVRIPAQREDFLLGCGIAREIGRDCSICIPDTLSRSQGSLEPKKRLMA